MNQTKLSLVVDTVAFIGLGLVVAVGVSGLFVLIVAGGCISELIEPASPRRRRLETVV